MRIGIITHSYLPQIDGVVRSVQIITKFLEKEGHTVFIFAPEYEKKQSKDSANVIRIESLLNPKFSNFETPFPNFLSPKSIKKINNAKLDIIHVQNPFLVGESSLMIGKILNIPVVFTYHTIYEQQAHYVKYFSNLISRLGLEWGAYFADRCDYVIAPSKRIMYKLKKLGVTQSISVIPTGIDFELVNNTKAANLNKFGFNKNDKILISVGRLGFDKRVLMIIDLIIPFLKENKNIKYLICGDGPEKETIKSLITREGLEKQVRLLGNVEYTEVFSLLKASDLFLIGSKDETQGMSVLEALSCKVPVLAIKEDWLNNWKTDSVIKATQNNFANKIKENIKNSTNSNLSSKAYKYALNYSEEVLIKKLILLYKKAIKTSESESVRKGLRKQLDSTKSKIEEVLK